VSAPKPELLPEVLMALTSICRRLAMDPQTVINTLALGWIDAQSAGTKALTAEAQATYDALDATWTSARALAAITKRPVSASNQIANRLVRRGVLTATVIRGTKFYARAK
jgi:hypothetical protein